ncbi:PsiF family protein [Catenovulum adriaticum]|uniref:PsiF family protein n=1 Tax=Catenovulum adriaticum TaxID=2984846 RepID=A0ABY7ANM5_9ALTE|nr:PsiF family protein [Catenovulum sp. TS8]WAJ70823.1 PsiF family protein [Catenovulum sp. TS8]
MKLKLISSALIIVLCSANAFAGDKPKMSKEDRKAFMEVCKAEAKAEKVTKEERKQWMKKCIRAQFKAANAE